MSFSVGKCMVMHIGDKNPQIKHQMPDQELGYIKQEKELGVIISNNLKMSVQCTAANKITNNMLGFITRNIYHKSPDIMKMLYARYYFGHRTTLKPKTR